MKHDHPIREKARDARRNPSRAEHELWQLLRRRQLGHKFRRQHPIGPYIVDFCCVGQRLVIEIDGPFHDVDDDRLRDTELTRRGYRVLRFSTNRVLSDDGVVSQIRSALGS